MRSKRLSWTTLMIVFWSIGVSREAGALANRVFLSAKSGNDANACNNIVTPCQTFAGAVAQLNPGGEAIVLDSGGYGAVTIAQAVTIEAPPGVLAFVHPASGDGITVNAGGGDTVVLRGIVLNGGANNGITVNTVGVLHVENCVISGFVNSGLEFLASGQLFVKDTIARNNGTGIVIDAASGNPTGSLDHCRLEGNTTGFGLTRGSATIRDSVASGNTGIGYFASPPTAIPVDLNIENCLAANNPGTGILSSRAATTVRVSDTTITGNALGVNQANSGVMLSRSNNTLEGNATDGTFTGTYTAK